MAQTNFTPILTYKSDTASAVPSAANLTNSTNGAELAVNTADKRLFTKDSGGNVVEIGTNPSSLSLPNGTANGVVYANGSKVLTTGSALTFDGTNFGVGTASPTATGNYRVTEIKSANATSGGMLILSTSDNSGIARLYNTSTQVILDDSSSTSDIFIKTNGINPLLFGVNNTEQMRLTSTGLGIGTSSPSGKLDVTGSVGTVCVETTGNKISFTRNGANYISAAGGASASINYDAPVHYFNSGDGATTRVTLNNSGNLGIGTTSPETSLTINNNTSNGLVIRSADTNCSTTDIGVSTSSAISYIAASRRGTGTYQPLAFYTGGSERMRLDASGNLGLGGTPSAWNSQWTAQDFKGASAVFAFNTTTDPALISGVNVYVDGSSSAANAKYKVSSEEASMYRQYQGIHSWFTAPSGTAGNAISFSQVMTLDASGNLGIGTTSPSQKLHVYTNAASDTFARIGNNTSGLNCGVLSTGVGSVNMTGNFALAFSTNNTERARIDSSGNLLVGKTSAGVGTSGLEVGSTGALFSSIASSTNTNSTLHAYSTTAAVYRFYVGMAGTVFATSTSISAISDATLKENVRDLETGLNEVMALRPRRFDWKEETRLPDKNVAGFIAQEVEQVLPELVYDYQYSADTTKKSLKMGDILPTLVKAIQEQQAIITDLRARVAALEAA